MSISVSSSIKKQPYPPSYYAATANQAIDDSGVISEQEVETCIIGGGYAGLMTALSLIERGYNNIVVLEKNQVGWGASGRNGGFVFGGYSLGGRAIVNQIGKQRAQELYQMTTSAVNLIRSRIHQYQISCDVTDAGVIWANWFKDQQILLQEKEFMQQVMQVDWQYLSPEVLADKIHSQRYHGGLFEPNAMHFHPLNYALGIANEILKKGGKIYQNSEVLDIDYQAACKLVKTEKAVIKCKNVVLAGGGYLGKLCPPVARSVLPIATYVMATEPLGEQLVKCINTQAAIYDTRFAFDYYRPLNDSRILWGGRISASTRTPANLDKQLRLDLKKVFPQLGDCKIDYVWDGWMSYSRHQMAQIGALAPGVWYAIGFGGHGVAPTTVAGEIVASAITGQSQDYKKFSPWGLPWNGGSVGPIAAQMSYWWYELKDWLKERLE